MRPNETAEQAFDRLCDSIDLERAICWAVLGRDQHPASTEFHRLRCEEQKLRDLERVRVADAVADAINREIAPLLLSFRQTEDHGGSLADAKVELQWSN